MESDDASPGSGVVSGCDAERRRALLSGLEARLRAIGLGEAFNRRLVKAFLLQGPELVGALEQGAAGEDLAAARRALHSLHGASVNLGLASLVDRCRETRQSMIRSAERPPAARAPEDVAILAREFGEAFAWLRDWLRPREAERDRGGAPGVPRGDG